MTDRREKVASAVYDRGRRGAPLPGCDCVQCFGYCMIDPDVADRERITRSETAQQSPDTKS